jgi:transposase
MWRLYKTQTLANLDCPQKVRHFLGAFFMRRKFSIDFKLKIVKGHLEDFIGIDALSLETLIDRSLIRKWVRFYELYGVSGLERSRNFHYSFTFKLKVVKSVSSGMSIKEAARKFNIAAESSIIQWRDNYEKSGILGLENRPRGRPKTMSNYKRKKRKTNKPLTREEELLEQIEYLKAENAILKKLDALIQERKNPKPSKN